MDASIYEANCSTSSVESIISVEINEDNKRHQEILHLKDQISSLSDDLNRELDQKIKLENINEELQSKNLILINEISRLKQQVKKFRNEDDELYELREENKELKKSNISYQAKHRNLNKDVENCMTKLIVSERQNKDLEETISHMKQEIYKLKTSITKQEAICSNLEKTVFEKDNNLDMYRESIDELRKEKQIILTSFNASLCNHSNEDSQPQSDCASMDLATEMRISELNSQIEEMTQSWVSPVDFQKHQTHCANLKKQISLLNENFSEVKSELETLEEQRLSSEKELKNQISLLTENCSKAKSELESSEEQRLSIEKELKNQISLLTENCSKAESALVTSKQQKLLVETELNDQISQLKENCSKLETAVVTAEQQSLLKEKELENGISMLTEKCSKAELALVTCEKQKLLIETELNDQIYVLKENCYKFESAMLAAEQHSLLNKKELENSIFMLTEKCSKAESALLTSEQQKTTIENNFKKSFLDIANRDEKIKLLLDQIDALKSELGFVETELTTISSKCIDLVNFKDKLVQENKKLKEVTHQSNKVSNLATNLIKKFPSVEEPDAPFTYKQLTLERIAELQERNSKQNPHLKSSYPAETQGSTPSRCDEAIRNGDPNETLRRISGHSTATGFNASRTRHLNQGKINTTTRAGCKRVLELDHVTNNYSCSTTVDEKIQPGVAFDITFTPPKRKVMKKLDKKKLNTKVSSVKSKSQKKVYSDLIKPNLKTKSNEDKCDKKGRLPLSQVDVNK